MQNQVFSLFFFLSLTIGMFAQSGRKTIKGTIKDSSSGETLIGVNIRVEGQPNVESTTNEHGFYSLTLPEGIYTLEYYYIGFQLKQVKVDLTEEKTINIGLEYDLNELNEVNIIATPRSTNVTDVQMGVGRLDIKEISKLPSLMGERDVIKAIQLMPGVKSNGEGNTGFHVRGGDSDQNLILLDNAIVYNVAHLFGFFSTFNSDAIKDVTLYKGAMPVQYGERISSALDIMMKEGNNQGFQISGGIGLISSKLNIEGPIQKEKSSFLVSGRRTYADAIARLAGSKEAKNSTLYFYDLNAKMNYILSDKDRLFLSGYFGKDKFGFDKMMGLDWGNIVGSLRWNRIINSKLFSNTSLVYNQYNYNIDLEMIGDNAAVIQSKLQDYSLKQDFRYYYSPQSTFQFGFTTTYHDVLPGEIKSRNENYISSHPMENRYSWENGAYLSHDFKLTDKLNILYGLRLSTFSALGKGTFYELDNQQKVIDSIEYSSGEFVKTYLNLEPRLSVAYKLNNTSSFKAAYGRTTQNMHLLSNSSRTRPMDRWTSSSNYIKPQIADQISLGYFKNLAGNEYEFSVETYYKKLQNQIDYKDGAQLSRQDIIETELLFGQGRTYGLELLLKKKRGRFTGWLGYTLSRSEKQIDGINNNEWYATRQDRTHDISLVGMYELNKKWSLSASWVYYTGNAVSYPSGKYNMDGMEVLYYTERNGYRAPDYHRLDLGATCVLKDTKKFYSELSFSLYNAYGRENAYMIDFRENESDPTQSEAYQIALFRFVPSVSWNFKF